MKYELDQKEVDLLRHLVERELDEINPEIRRSATMKTRIELRQDREILRGIADRLHTHWADWPGGMSMG